jgi:hypothetical protein
MVRAESLLAADSLLLITIVIVPTDNDSVNCNGALSSACPLAPRSLGPVITSTAPEITSLGVSVLTPKFVNGRFLYREHVTARVTYTLSGRMLHPFGGVVLGPATTSASQFALVCYAVCRSCTSQASSSYQQCNPTGFYLDPIPSKRNQGFKLDESNGTLTGNVTFKIRSRRKWPRSEDREWRCLAEALM